MPKYVDIEKAEEYVNLSNEAFISLKSFYIIPKDTPTADAVPVVHGHWIDSKHTDTVICSRCKSCFSYETPYCPKCGAKMDGGNKNA